MQILSQHNEKKDHRFLAGHHQEMVTEVGRKVHFQILSQENAIKDTII